MSLTYHAFLFYLMFVPSYWILYVAGSKSCEIFLNNQADLRTLKGIWYRTLDSSNSSAINACVRFEVEAIHRKKAKISIVDMQSNANIDVIGTLKPGGKLEISTKVFTLVTYNIAIIHHSYFCLYECGDGSNYDYVQCATKTTTVSDNLMKTILNSIQSIGMMLDSSTFKRTATCTIHKKQ